MIGSTLTKSNLIAIYEAMSKIKEIDRSEYFKQYYKELEDRIKETSVFRIYNENGKEYIERLVYPKFRAVIAFGGALSDLDDIEMDEDVYIAQDIATAMREAADYLINYNK